jgi:hypothetical protein
MAMARSRHLLASRAERPIHQIDKRALLFY